MLAPLTGQCAGLFEYEMIEGPYGECDETHAGDEFGRSVTLGDFNGDGFDDLAVAGKGNLWIFYWNPTNHTYGWLSDGVEYSILASDYDTKVLAANVNGDSYDDLLMSHASTVQAWYGGPTGIDFANPDWVYYDSTAIMGNLAAVDGNGDGIPGFMVGRSSDNPRVEGFYGNAGGLPSDLSRDYAFFGSDVVGMAEYQGVYYWLRGFGGDGQDVARAGPILLSGKYYDRMAIGMEYTQVDEDQDGIINLSESKKLYGAVMIGPVGQILSGDLVPDSHFGYALGDAGDVNGDGLPDLLVSARQNLVEPYLGSATVGSKVFLYLGRDPAFGGVNPNYAWAVPAPIDRGDGAYGSTYHFGATVGGAGDINGDGYADIFVSDDRYDNLGGRSNTAAGWRGRCFIWYGAPRDGGDSSQLWYRTNVTEADLVLAGDFRNGAFGRSFAAGDINGDGLGDLVVADPTALSSCSSTYRENIGAVVVYLSEFGSDLSVSVSQSPQDITTSDTAVFTATVSNLGQKPSSACQLDLTLRQSEAEGEHLYNIPALAAGESYTVQREMMFTNAGFYTLRGTADFLDQVVEYDEANNIRDFYFQVSTGAQPALSVSSTNFSPGIIEGQNPPSDSFEVWNSGGGSLDYVVTEGLNWLTCTPTNGTSTGEHDSIQINYNTAALPPGLHTGSITVTADGAEGSPRSVAVALNVIPAPVLSVSPTNLNPICAEGENATSGSFEVWNGGGGNLDYVITESIDWLTVTPSSGTSTGEHDTITVNYATANLAPALYRWPITIRAAGASASTQEVTVTLIVDYRPVLDAGPDQAVTEGFAVSLAPATFVDIFGTHTATIDWGDGTDAESGLVDESARSISGTHVYADQGSYVGTVTVTDKYGVSASDNLAVTVNNAAPAVNAGPDQVIVEGTLASLAPATFSDPGTLDTHTATIDWGDGTGPMAGVVAENPFGPPGSTSGADGTVSGSHTYAAIGTYTVMVTVTDDDGGSASDTLTLTVTQSPALTVSPTSLSPRCGEGTDAPNGSFEVWNSGGGHLDYVVSESIDWLSVAPTSGTSAGQHDVINVNYATAGLAAGTYTGTITVSAAGTSGSPQEVAVTLRVASSIQISAALSSSNTITLSWAGGEGAWLERSPTLENSDWSSVPGSEGANQIELPATNSSAFYRVASLSQAIPLITQHPVSVAVAQGAEAEFSVLAGEPGSVSYEWRFNGTSLSGADSPILLISNVQPANVGEYVAVVSKGSISQTSSPAALVITAPLGELVWIPSNTFAMGSPVSEVDRDADEGPQTTVTFTKGHWIGAYEVTQQEYSDVTGTNPSFFNDAPDRPVEFLSWEDATNYCATLTERERTAGRIPSNYEYRLPTEAEWEYTCRAGTTTRFSYGDDIGYASLGDYAWYDANSSNMTQRVGRKLPNPWGLYDTYGNVWEWCQDWYADAYSGGSVIDPMGPATGSMRVVRGGSYYFGGAPCRSANRGAVAQDGSRYDLGFRVVLAPVLP